MSTGICGKRIGFEEIFGSPTAAPSAKRSRCASYDSSVGAVEWGLGIEDKVSILVGLFPSTDREVIETVLRNHDYKVDATIKSLQDLSTGGSTTHAEAVHDNSMPHGSQKDPLEGEIKSEASAHKYECAENDIPEPRQTMPKDVSSWSDVFVDEMKNASDWDAVRCRAMKVLESFKEQLLSQSSASVQRENSSLKEQLHSWLKDNQILQSAVAIQHERSLEQEAKLKEVQQLKHLMSQYQGQIRVLELNNYTLNFHLQKAQYASCIQGRFHPDIF